ncbi:hypothetical protein [uncultured Friedmanniella sp.]|uniref:hypothetical protein n=1 Tax=uncultured Friedmanniella sp. TaxID=335381 RepID=UPI0035CA9689
MSRPLLWWVGSTEALTLAVLLVNLATVHVGGLAAALGPVHGLLYLVGVVLVWSSRSRWSARLLVLVPAVGTLLALRVAPQPDRVVEDLS